MRKARCPPRGLVRDPTQRTAGVSPRQQRAARRDRAACANHVRPKTLPSHTSRNFIASAKTCKQPGSDGVVVEMVRALSWSTLLWLFLLFLVRLGGWEAGRLDAWREVVLTAIPKKSEKGGFSINEIHQSAACDTKVLHSCFTDRCQT